MRLAATWLAAEDQTAPFRHKVRRERRSEEGQTDGRLIREVEIIDRFKKRKVRPPDETVQARVLSMRDFFVDQQREEIMIGPFFLLGASRQVPPRPSGVGEMEAFQKGVEVMIGEVHDRPPSASKGRVVLGRLQVLRFAPVPRAPAATWTRPPRDAGSAVAAGRSNESCS